MQEMQEILNKFNLPEGRFVNNSYIINLNSDIEWSNIFSIINLDSEFKLDGKSKATEAESSFLLTNGFYDIKFEANYNKNVYTIVIEER